MAAPPQCLLTETLADALRRHGRVEAWVRLGREDRDHGVLLTSVIAAAQHHAPGLGETTLELMRRRPGPVDGWPRLYEHLGRELAAALGPSVALVIDHAHHLDGAHLPLRLLFAHLLPALPGGAACVIVSHEPLPSAALPEQAVHLGPDDLRVDERVAARLIRQVVPDFGRRRVQDAIALCDGQAGAIAALRAAAAELGPEVVSEGLVAGGLAELLTFVGRAWLSGAGPDTQRGLALAVRLGYCHPGLCAAMLGCADPPSGPWSQALARGWTRIRTGWGQILPALLPAGAQPDPAAMHRVADHLLLHGADDQAIRLFLQLDDSSCAARAVEAVATRLLDLGQWQTLGEWLGRLGQPELEEHPWLLYSAAEIAAARGEVAQARRQLVAAADRFADQGDADGSCQSMLAESALAASALDVAHAHARALAARALAVGGGLVWHETWACWQLGSLAASAGDFDEALTYFGLAGSAAARTGDNATVEFVQRAEQLTRRLQQLHEQRELHRSIWATLEVSMRELVEELQRVLGAPSEDLTSLVQEHGWSRTPLALKLPPPEPLEAGADGAGFWSKALRALGLRREFVHGPAELSRPPVLVGAPVHALDTRDLAARPQRGVTSTGVPAERARGPVLTVHLLGPLQVTLDEVPIDDWPSGRGRALLKYLLTHRDPWPPRDVLMDAFWPDARPDAARNNLNVAVHGLRRALRAAADVPVVVFRGDTYRLHPDLLLWLDVDEFERHVAVGRELEATGELRAAMAEYEVASGLYGGDFLADDPYAEWPVLTRERLRLAYLDTLDRLSHLYFSQGRFASCAALCQRIMERDACREDVHRRLMRCYSRQGQPNLALRQYRACVEALRDELGVDPAPGTAELAERIRRREPV